MNQVRVIYHLARADFLERVRRYSFLIMLGLVVFLGYQAAIGNIYVQVGEYRGEFNSAWVGSMMSAIASAFLGWFGFYLVKGSVSRDRETGVGQIMATTPLTRPLYVLGKWLSNFVVLVSMIVILAIAAVIIQYLTGESAQIDLIALLTPFLFITLPAIALVAAVAVLSETIGFLSGGFGNIIYFFLFAMVIPLGDALTKQHPALEPLGISLLQRSMGAAAKAVFPDYDGGFMLGSTDVPAKGVFHWSGVDWTPGIILNRITIFGIAIVLTLLASLFFDRFDPSRRRPKRKKDAAPLPRLQAVSTNQTLSQPISLTPLTRSQSGSTFFRILTSELKLLLKGQRWWWYLGAIGLFVASLFTPVESVRTTVLPFAWIWPILVWSGMGNREIRHNAQQMVFSSAAPLMRQLPASWVAGFIVAVLTGSGVALKLMVAGDGVGMLAWFSAVLFIPSFALALGVWSNSHKLFEVLYVTLWYIGPMNYVYAVDFIGTKSDGNIGFFIPISFALILAAIIGRAKQLQN
jgi:ABC-type transport system involved in multi-copper enzyme maturation permease subunit